MPQKSTITDAPTYKRALLATLLTTVVVTALAYVLPDSYTATGVGLGFMAAVYWLVLRRPDQLASSYGLSLGGLLDAEPLSWRRMAGDSLRAIGWALLIGVIIFPPFVVGFGWWWSPDRPFAWTAPPSGMLDEILGQLLVIALPEEAFFRGYLQTELDRASDAACDIEAKNPANMASPVRGITIFGARVGWSTPVSATIFAMGHFLTEPNPQRLAVFFPALLFSWLRARTGGIGAGLLLHAMSNVIAAALGRGYGLF